MFVSVSQIFYDVIGQDVSFWQWFWRRLYCLNRLVARLTTRKLYTYSQCTYVHTQNTNSAHNTLRIK